MAKRILFSKFSTKGEKNQEALMEKYKAHIEDNGGDIKDITDEMKWQEYGLGEGDVDWIVMRLKLHHSYNYPDLGTLMDVYKEWYKNHKKGPETNVGLAVSKNEFMVLFTEAANAYDKNNRGKSVNEPYLRKKINTILMAIEEKTGQKLRNPLATRKRKISAKEAVGTDFDWL